MYHIQNVILWLGLGLSQGQLQWHGWRLKSIRLPWTTVPGWVMNLLGSSLPILSSPRIRWEHQSYLSLPAQQLLLSMLGSLLLLSRELLLVWLLSVINWIMGLLLWLPVPQTTWFWHLSACQLATVSWTVLKQSLGNLPKSVKSLLVRVGFNVLNLHLPLPVPMEVLHLLLQQTKKLSPVELELLKNGQLRLIHQKWILILLPWLLLLVVLSSTVLPKELLSILWSVKV